MQLKLYIIWDITQIPKPLKEKITHRQIAPKNLIKNVDHKKGSPQNPM